jgi:hypothetical protein
MTIIGISAPLLYVRDNLYPTTLTLTLQALHHNPYFTPQPFPTTLTPQPLSHIIGISAPLLHVRDSEEWPPYTLLQVFIFIYIYVYMYIYVHVYQYLHICIFIYINKHTCMYVYMYLFIYLFITMDIFLYICLFGYSIRRICYFLLYFMKGNIVFTCIN